MKRRRERKKRRREEREEEEAGLDDEDLDLIGEANPDFEIRKQVQVCRVPMISTLLTSC